MLNTMKATKGKVLYTGGTFDVLHAGHINFLRMCKLLVGEAGKVFVSLNTDEFIKEFKGNPPLFTYAEREELLRQIEYVDDVVSNTGGADSKPAILKVKPDIIAIGTDWMGKDYYKQMGFSQRWLDECNIVLVYLPYTTVISTSEIKKRINTQR